MTNNAAANDRQLVVRRTLAAPQERVFEAWTRPELLAQWFFAGPGWSCKPTADVQVGGRYRLEMIEPDGTSHVQFGQYVEVTPFHRIVFSWTCPEVGVEDSVVTVELEARGDATELTLTHRLPDDADIVARHEGGWIGCLGTLDQFLKQPTP